jgi:hypothetical protein
MNMNPLIVATVFTVLFFLIYKFVFNPQIIANSVTTQCPENWSYNAPLCSPNYDTICQPFDPSKMSKAQKMETAQQCAVQWN